MMVLYVVVGVVVAALALNALNRRRTDDLRQTGFLPPPGQGSDADVERLVALGRKIDAIKLYREVHGTDLKTAKDAVDKMAEKPGSPNAVAEQNPIVSDCARHLLARLPGGDWVGNRPHARFGRDPAIANHRVRRRGRARPPAY